ncbi:hypothetical protein BHM03_00033685 [Ensete ventricosum]|nr:hypothetical protein BHM03_00033685 [Ensete ventricosum]
MTDCGQPARGCRPQARSAAASPQGVAARGQVTRGGCSRRASKRLSPAARPQVVATHCKVVRGSPTARATACKGGHWQERPPAGAAPA